MAWEPSSGDHGDGHMDGTTQRHHISRWGSLLVLVALAAPAAQARAAGDPLSAGREALRACRWDDARPLLLEARIGPTRAEALQLLARLELVRGRVTEALEVVAEAELVPGLEAPASRLKGEAFAARGQYAEALQAYAEARRLDPELDGAALDEGLLQLALGRKGPGRALLEPLVAADDHGGHPAGEDLVILGRAAVALGYVKMGFDALDEATERSPELLDAHLHLGLVALERGDGRHAFQGLQAALSLCPEHPRALVAKARLVAFAEQDYDAVEALLRRALAVHPNHPDALRLRAELALSDEDPAAARAALAPVLQANPNDLAALALLAASWELDDNPKELAAVRRRVRAVHPSYAKLWAELGRFAERAHRYPDAVRHARRALKVDPDYWPALRQLGINLTRIGKEDEGRRALERFYERDTYDRRVVNTLNLFERFLKEYEVLRRGGVRLRAHRDELPLLDLIALPLLEEVDRGYHRSYGFTPKGPLSLEIFHERELFGIRSVGLPAVMSHGVSFGRLVTARSPSSDDFNWAQVLAHELSHIYGLQLSRYRVGRWLTEGLAEYETNMLRPEWSRHHNVALHQALHAGRLPSLAQINHGFTHARQLGDVLVAYQQSSLAVHFLVELWGYPQVIALHRRLGRGEQQEAALEAVTGLSFAELDQRFLAWLRQRLAYLDGALVLDRAAYFDGEALGEQLRRAPEDPDALAAMAAHLLLRTPPARPRPGEALRMAERALRRVPKHELGLYVAGLAAVAVDRPADARKHLEALHAAHERAPEVERVLAELALRRGDLPAALSLVQAAVAHDPHDVAAARLRAQLALTRADDLQLAEALQALSLVDQNDPLPPLQAAVIRRAHGDFDAALQLARRALESGLFRVEVHHLLARLHLQAQQPTAALRHAWATDYLIAWYQDPGRIQAPFGLGPDLRPLRRPVLREVARALQAQGKLGVALRPLQRRLTAHSAHPIVVRLSKVLAHPEASVAESGPAAPTVPPAPAAPATPAGAPAPPAATPDR